MYDHETYYKPVTNRRSLTCPKCKSDAGYVEAIGFEQCGACGYFVDYHRGTVENNG